MEELEELLDDDSVDVLLLDESVEVDELVDELDSELLVLIECEELDSVESDEALLLENELPVLLELDSDDALLGDSELVDRLDSVDPLLLLRECDELDVVTLRELSDPVEWLLERLDDERL